MRKDWEIKSLDEIATVKGGKRVPKGYQFETTPTLHPYISVSDFTENGTVCTKNLKYISDEIYNQIKNYTISSQDIYISIAGTIGKTGLVPKSLDGANLTENACKLVLHKGIDKKFVYFFTKTDDFVQQTGINTRVSAQPKLALVRLKTITLPIPPLPEQKRIVAILDEAFEGIDRAIANTEKNLANALELFESYLNAIFTQKGEGWVESNLGAVCKFQGGSQPPKSGFSTEKKEGYIRLIQIRDYKSDKYLVYIPTEKAKRFCKPDDVMIGRYGPPLFQILRGLEGAYNVALMKAVPNEEFLSKDFLFYFLKNRNILHYIISSSSRTAGQTGLNKATIEPYPIAFPTLEKQAIIVAQLQELKAETQRLETIYRQKLAALNELKQSILQKAFTGELTVDTQKTVKEELAA